MIFVLDSNSQQILASIPQDAKISVIKGFDGFLNTLFIGLTKASLVGSKSFFRISVNNSNLEVEAH